MNRGTKPVDASMPSNGKESLSTLSAWAKALLRSGETVKAEDYFSRAIARIEASTTELPTTWLMDMLEGRAAAREQSGRLEEALADGNRMLKVEKSNPRVPQTSGNEADVKGYICLGRLLENKKKVKSALKCYAYGMTQCAQSHELFLDLVKAHHTLTRVISETERIKSSRDPICTFPHEILIMVFEYLPFRDMMKCHRVSRDWRTFLSSEPSLYRSIDLISVCKPLGSIAIKRLISLSNAGIGTRSMAMLNPSGTFANYSVPGFPECKTQTLSLLRQLFKNLEVIDIFCGGDRRMDGTSDVLHHGFDILPLANIRHINIKFAISPTTFVKLCDAAPHLEFLDCCLSSNDVNLDPATTYPRLKAFSLIATAPDFSHWAEICGRWFPNLEEVILKQLIGNTRGGESHGDCEFNLNNLRVLRLVFKVGEFVNLRLTSKEMRIVELTRLGCLQVIHLPIQPHLEELHLLMVRSLQNHVLQQFYESAKSLQHLTISSPQFTPKDVDQFLREGLNLRSIKLSHIDGINDSTLGLLHSLHRLESLEINYCTEVTGNGIINLVKSLSVKKGRKLRSISIGGNENIRRQTIDWARDQGVIISI